MLQPLIAGTEQKTPFVNGTLQAKEQGMNLNSNNVVRVPDRTAFRTQGADGGTRETPQKPSEHLGGATQPKQTLSCANPYDAQSERVYHGDGAWHSLSSNSRVGRAETPSSQAVDVYNQTIDGEISASVTAAAGGTNTSGPKVMWGGFKPRQSAKARSLGYAEEQAPTISTDENYADCGGNRT